MLKKRVLTGVLLVLLFSFTLMFDGARFFSFLLIAGTAIASYEWSRLAGISDRLHRFLIAVLTAAVLTLLLFLFQSSVYSSVVTIAWVSALFWATIVVNFFVSPSRIWPLQSSLATLVFGLLLLGSVALALSWLVDQANGVVLLAVLVGIIVLADSGAYFSGKRFGKHKLAPLISPGKTLEGLLGGVALAIAVVLIVAFSLGIEAGYLPALLFLTVLTALFSVVGDLFESSAKRIANVKDSGTILPGHGGVLDRFDGVLAATPIFILIQHYFAISF